MPDQEGIKRLEALVAVDRKVAQTQSELDKLRLELRETKADLKKLKALDPERMKRNLAESKKKLVIKNSEIKARNAEILTVRKQLREATKELDLSQNELDHFYTSPCERWRLFFSGFQFPEETPNPDSVRIRCVDRKTGTSVIATGLVGDKALWSDDIGISEEVTKKAAEHILVLGEPAKFGKKRTHRF